MSNSGGGHGTHTPTGTPTSDNSPKATRQKLRYRFIFATPLLTTLLVLGLGIVIVYMIQQEVFGLPDSRTNAEQLYKQLAVTLNHVTIVIVIGAVLAFVSGLVVALAITNPIKMLTLDAASIARGDLTRKIRFKADGELALLGTAFNEMVASINEYMLQSMSGGLLTINEKGEITSMTGDTEVIIGAPADRVLGHHITEIFPESMPENKRFLELIQTTLREKHTFPQQKLEVSTHERQSVPISLSAYLLRDKDNILIGLGISFEDVRKLRRIEEQMLKVDRLTTLGGLAAGIAHQIRNPLCSIQGLAQLLKENRPEDTALNDYSDIILKDVNRIDQVIRRLMRFLQPTNTDWTMESINDILKDSLLLARSEIRGKNIELIEDYDAGLPLLSVQRENIQHAFLNLIMNAIQAIETKGAIYIRTFALRQGNPDIVSPAVGIEIEDNGPGIQPEAMEKIFFPSFTTKPQGSGFGLPITRQTIEAHGGEIGVTSEPGVKTIFTIRLPVRTLHTEEAPAIEHVAGR